MQVLSVGRAAEALGISITTVRRMAKKGKLQSVRTKGGHRRIIIDDCKPSINELWANALQAMQELILAFEPIVKEKNETHKVR